MNFPSLGSSDLIAASAVSIELMLVDLCVIEVLVVYGKESESESGVGLSHSSDAPHTSPSVYFTQ
jgi:hypothetical protein